MPIPFERSVFINCPFDDGYRPLFRCLIFTTLSLGLEPRTAFEDANGGEPRITKLVRLIRSAKFGIHDLSRCRATKKGELFRLNMPLELGIDYGCREYFGGNRRSKKLLILDTERYRFQQAVSDLAGSDIKAHKDDAATLIKVTRDWFVQIANVAPISASAIMAHLTNFTADHYDEYAANNYSRREIDELPLHEVQKSMRRWVRQMQQSN